MRMEGGVGRWVGGWVEEWYKGERERVVMPTHLGAALIAFGKGNGGGAGVVREVDAHVVVEVVPTLCARHSHRCGLNTMTCECHLEVEIVSDVDESVMNKDHKPRIEIRSVCQCLI